MTFRVRVLTLLLLPCWALGSPVRAQEPEEAPVYANLAREFGEAYRSWSMRVRSTRDPEERKQLLAAMPAREFLPRFQEGAKAHAGTDAAVPFLIWILSNSDIDSAAGAAEIVVEAHAGHPLAWQSARRIGSMADHLGRAKTMLWLSQLVDGAPDGEPAAQARMARAMMSFGTTGSPESDEEREQALVDLEAALASAQDSRTKQQLQSMLYEIRNLEVGMKAPDIEGDDLDGKPFKLSDQLGKVVLLDFWGDWSGASRAMYAGHQQWVQQWQDRPFVLVGVNGDPDKERLKQRIAAVGINWRSFWNGPGGRRGPISAAWHVRGWPTLYVIDHEGTIRHKSHGGPGVEQALQKWIDIAEQAGQDDRD